MSFVSKQCDSFKAKQFRSHEPILLAVKTLADSYMIIPAHSDIFLVGRSLIRYKCKLTGANTVSKKIAVSRHCFRKYAASSLLVGFNRGLW